MVRADRLGDVNDVRPALVIQQVEFTEVGVHQPTLPVHRPHVLHQLKVQLPRLGLGDLSVLQSWGGDGVRAEELHDEDVGAQHDGAGHGKATVEQTEEVAGFLLSPRSDHLARVVLPIPVAEPVIP